MKEKPYNSAERARGFIPILKIGAQQRKWGRVARGIARLLREAYRRGRDDALDDR